MSYSKYFLSSLLLFFYLNLSAQSDSITYTLPFYIEDAMGNRDTVYASGSSYAEAGYNPQLGEVNLFNVPFDSVLEARLYRAVDLFDYQNRPPVCSKQLVTRFYDFGTPGDCTFTGESISLAVNAKYPPVTISWEQDIFQEGGALFCAQGTYIVNSMIPFSISSGGWYGYPEYETACLAHEASSKMFTPWGGVATGGPLLYDYVLYPVEGSVNELDTLQMFLVYGNFTGTEPCATYINSTEAPEIAPEAFQLYPNPAQDRVYLDIDSGVEFREIEVISFTGQVVYRGATYDSGGVDVSKLPPGVYVLRYQTTRGEMGSRRFIKQ